MSSTAAVEESPNPSEEPNADCAAIASAARRLECLAAKHTSALRRDGAPTEITVSDPAIAAAILRLLGPGARFFDLVGARGDVIRLNPPATASTLELIAAVAALETAADGVLGEEHLDTALL